MPQILTFIVVVGAIALLVTRVRSGRMHLRFAEWPLGQQIECGLSVLFGVLAALAALAGEYAFASWLIVMAALLMAFAVLTWPRDSGGD